MVNLPICLEMECCNNLFDSEVRRYVCAALTSRPDPCPFFKTQKQAREDRDAAQKRAADAGCLVKGFYSAPMFVKVDDEGKEVPDIKAWLKWLWKRDILTEARYNELIAKQP